MVIQITRRHACRRLQTQLKPQAKRRRQTTHRLPSLAAVMKKPKIMHKLVMQLTVILASCDMLAVTQPQPES